MLLIQIAAFRVSLRCYLQQTVSNSPRLKVNLLLARRVED